MTGALVPLYLIPLVDFVCFNHDWKFSKVVISYAFLHLLVTTFQFCLVFTFGYLFLCFFLLISKSYLHIQSVGFTAVPLFAIAAIWFLGFGLCFSLMFLCYFCCKQRHPYGYSRTAYALSLIFLALFTILAMYISPSLSLGSSILLFEFRLSLVDG